MSKETVQMEVFAVLQNGRMFMGMGEDVTDQFRNNDVKFKASPYDPDNVLLTGTIDNIKQSFKDGMDMDLTDEEISYMLVK